MTSKNLAYTNLGVASVHVLTSQVLITRIVRKRRNGWANFIAREFTERLYRLTLLFYLEAKEICTLHCMGLWILMLISKCAD